MGIEAVTDSFSRLLTDVSAELLKRIRVWVQVRECLLAFPDRIREVFWEDAGLHAEDPAYVVEPSFCYEGVFEEVFEPYSHDVMVRGVCDFVEDSYRHHEVQQSSLLRPMFVTYHVVERMADPNGASAPSASFRSFVRLCPSVRIVGEMLDFESHTARQSDELLIDCFDFVRRELTDPSVRAVFFRDIRRRQVRQSKRNA